MTAPPFSIRPATLDDIDRLADIVMAATKDQGRFQPPQGEAAWREGITSWTREHITHPDGVSTLSVIVVNGDVMGRLRIERTDTAVFLAGIQIHPDAQSRGIGTAILTMLRDEARDTGRALTLSVERDNPRAHALYRRFGFATTGETDKDLQLTYQDPA